MIGEAKALATSKKGIPDYSKGFWKDHRHLASQFEYLAEVPALTEVVESKLSNELGRLEMYLKDQFKTVEFLEQLEDIERKCEVEYSGSTTLKDIYILKASCKHLYDGTGAELIRVEDDGPPQSPAPHIYAVDVGR